MKTVLEVLQSGATFLKKKGVDEARLNMEHLLAHVLGLRRLQLYLQFDRPLGERELSPLRELVERRGKGEPLQHLLGTVEFAGHLFKCDARALIPRPETEQLVGRIIERANPPGHAPRQILDVGCGTGVIGLSLAAKFTQARVTLVDISPEALALARENAAELSLEKDRLFFLQSDLLSSLDGGDKFDLIAANLPYVATSEIDTLSREVQHDPRLALDGGESGLELIERLISQLPGRSAPGALVALEFGLGQGPQISAGLETIGCREVTLEKDFTGRERFAFATYAAG